MDTNALSKLSAEQLEVLNDELKAVFCSLAETDQVFFAKTFKPKDLPIVLARKAEIMKRDQAARQQLDELEKALTQAEAEAPAEGGVGDVLAAAAGAVGVGAAAVAVATDNTAFYQGVKPSDLVEPLRTEFQTGNTITGVSGSPEALIFTVYLSSQRTAQRTAAMNINLTAMNNGTEVKVNELTSQGILQTIKDGGEKLLDLAGKGLSLLRRGKSGENPEELLSDANQTLQGGASLAESVHNLKLKERAWKVIRQAAEAIEANYRDQVEQERKARDVLEQAWDQFYNCPTCGVTFGEEENECRVCGSARPEKPVIPDPRQKL